MTARHIDDYWAEVNTYNPLNMSRPDNVAVLFKIFIESYPESVNHREKLAEYFYKAHGQVYQDLVVQMYLGWKHDGYFVEFGATDGYDISNTYLLEKEFGWSGILAEPARHWHDKLPNNRSCNIDFNCVWPRSNEKVMFNEGNIRPDASTAEIYMDYNSDIELFRGGTKEIYEVDSISLLDLLAKYNAPKNIDFISMDTEGSEFDILTGFDFNQYKVKFFSIEHNSKEVNRQKIYNLMVSKGYERVLANISQWDDFYLLKE
jgi:FkbM family methyltransferase